MPALSFIELGYTVSSHTGELREQQSYIQTFNSICFFLLLSITSTAPAPMYCGAIGLIELLLKDLEENPNSMKDVH